MAEPIPAWFQQQLAWVLSGACGPVEYARRQPERTVLHRVVRENLATFLAQTEGAGVRLPRNIEREMRAFLRCGILAHGFIRAECEACRRALLVAFSCKGPDGLPMAGVFLTDGLRLDVLVENLFDLPHRDAASAVPGATVDLRTSLSYRFQSGPW